MKTKYPLLFLLAFAFLSVNSQVVITRDNHCPADGEQYSYIKIENVAPGDIGNNCIWDLSQIKLDGDIIPCTQKSAESKEFDNFANTPFIASCERDAVYYHGVSDDSYELVGITTETYKLDYELPMVKMQYPFYYGKSFNGDFIAHAYKDDKLLKMDISGNYYTIADATGTLVLPNTIIPNVLRVKQNSDYVQANACNEVNISSTKYTYYSQFHKQPLLTIIEQTKTYQDGRVETKNECFLNEIALAYTENNSSQVENIKADFKYSIYPNPFDNQILISYSLEQITEIKIELFDILGVKVGDILTEKTQAKGYYEYEFQTINLNLKPGVYFIKLTCGNNAYTERLVKTK
jgi:hypothetical protein